MFTIALIVIAVGVLMDGFTLILNLLHCVRGYGPSGIPVVPLILYALGIAFASPVLTSLEVRESLGVGLLFHLSCQLFVAGFVYGVLSVFGRPPPARSGDAQVERHDRNA